MKLNIVEGPDRVHLEIALFAPYPDMMDINLFDETRQHYLFKVSSVCRGDAENLDIFIVRGTIVQTNKPATYTGNVSSQTGTLFIDDN